MKLYLLRHGKTKGNRKGRYVGRTDEPLCRDGISELQKLKKHYGLPDPDLLFVSPMLRCRQTAEIFFPGVRQILVNDFRECDFGAFEYHTWKELSKDARYQRWIDSGGRLPFPEGESREAFSKRCVNAFLAALAETDRTGCRTAAFLVHGGTIMSILEAFALPKQDYFTYQVKNGCGYLARWDKDPSHTALFITGRLPDEKRPAAPGKERNTV